MNGWLLLKQSRTEIASWSQRETSTDSTGEDSLKVKRRRFIGNCLSRDVSEALSRIAEKSAIISSQDNGRDLKAVQSLIRKHESFENDLVALEAQLQVLIDDSASLQSRYADLSGPHIAQQQKILLQDWNELQDKVRDRNILEIFEH